MLKKKSFIFENLLHPSKSNYVLEIHCPRALKSKIYALFIEILAL